MIRWVVVALAVVSAVLNFVMYQYLSPQNPVFLMYVAVSVLVAVTLVFPRLRQKLWSSRGRSPRGHARDGGEPSP
ncbi:MULTISPECIES: hypothetical protein [unclassified Microbacterium]|uniref:hypothetical protein n=1 Tax=unclassified Microbacterium TaxID=2609290 RepID=UPI00109D2312|nr:MULTISPECIES: hypothetical protein [unclassified Microbacterium]